MSEDEVTIEDVIEPYLLANGYLERTAKGRIATFKTYELLKISFLKIEVCFNFLVVLFLFVKILTDFFKSVLILNCLFCRV